MVVVDTMITPHSRLSLDVEDAARLHMSTADNPMTVTALLRLDRPILREELEARLETRLTRHARFRRCVAEPRLGLGRPRWVDDPAFDVRHHVHRIDTALLPDAPTLESLTSDLANIPLLGNRPLWRAHVIDGPDPAIVMVIHHALGDGAALLSLLAELVDEPTKRAHTDSNTPLDARSRARAIAAGAMAAGRLALARRDPETALRGRLGGRKVLAFSEAMSLDDLHGAARSLGITVTGLLLAAVAGACRAELLPNGCADGLVLHALVPIDLRHDAGSALGNHYGSILVPLPVGVPDLPGRVRRVSKEARVLRSRMAGVAGASLAAAAGAVAAVVERAGLEFYSRKATVVVSSVRGPSTTLRLCGASVRDVIVWAPT
ncbi:MAG: Diacylglycerol O-acyltransferase, partial [Labilithrix sp.]|nr:Diacylglycerol O-acyltransferase [Labilithrix sp.]